jgi:hypothetical protein
VIDAVAFGVIVDRACILLYSVRQSPELCYVECDISLWYRSEATAYISEVLRSLDGVYS